MSPNTFAVVWEQPVADAPLSTQAASLLFAHLSYLVAQYGTTQKVVYVHHATEASLSMPDTLRWSQIDTLPAPGVNTVYFLSLKSAQSVATMPGWLSVPRTIIRFHAAAPRDAVDPTLSILDVVVVDPNAQVQRDLDIVQEHPIFGASSTVGAIDLARLVVRVNRGAINALDVNMPTGATFVSIDRISRALIGKRCGLALSGGGVLAFFHAALMRALCDRNIPIDMVSGTSGGALAGAYYCVLGEAGLDQFIADRDGIFLSSLGAMFRQGPIAASVNKRLSRGGAPVDVSSLEVPLIPIAAQLGPNPSVCYAREGSVGHAVELSGAAPGFFAPVRDQDGRVYMDGTVCDFVPISTLLREGADHVLASSVFPVPVNNGSSTPWGRAHDLLDALTILAVSGSRVPDLFQLVKAPRLYGVNPALLAPLFPLGATMYARWSTLIPQQDEFNAWLDEWNATRQSAFDFPRPAA